MGRILDINAGGDSPGEDKPLPKLTLSWDPVGQNVRIDYDPKEFKTWDWVEMVLKAALRKVEKQANLQAMLSLPEMMQGFQQQRRHEMATQVEETTPEQLRNMLRK
jgi:hypothetical protein